MTSCQEVGEEAAVAVLTRQPLPPRIAAHLRDCPPCAKEWEELRSLSRLLAVAQHVDLEPAPPSDPALLERLLADVARSRRRRRLVTVAAAAAAALALAVPTGLWWSAGDGGSAAPVPSAAAGPVLATGTATGGTATGGMTGVRAFVEIRATASGSDVAVSTGGLVPGTVCRIVVVDRSGASEKAGSWMVSSDYRPGTAVHETVRTAPDQISHVDLIDESSGQRLLSVPVT